jgi:hypothetical protein
MTPGLRPGDPRSGIPGAVEDHPSSSRGSVTARPPLGIAPGRSPGKARTETQEDTRRRSLPAPAGDDSEERLTSERPSAPPVGGWSSESCDHRDPDAAPPSWPRGWRTVSKVTRWSACVSSLPPERRSELGRSTSTHRRSVRLSNSCGTALGRPSTTFWRPAESG